MPSNLSSTRIDSPSEHRPVELATVSPFALDDFEVEPARLGLAGQGGERRLEPRVMMLLVTLARSEGEVLSRAELLDRVWADAVVGDDALTMAVSKLRRALGKRHDGSPFVETIPRVGYRLRAEVRWTKTEIPVDPIHEHSLAEDAPKEYPPTASESGGALAMDRRQVGYLLAVVVIALLVGTSWLVHRGGAGPEHEAETSLAERWTSKPLRSRGLGAQPGMESQASFDPSGRRIVYRFLARDVFGGSDTGPKARAGDQPQYVEASSRLVVLDLETAESRTIFEGSCYSPAWSPVDQRIAFLTSGEGRTRLALTMASGGAIEPLIEIEPSVLVGIDWSPDGRSLAWSGRDEELDTFSLWEVDVESRGKRRLSAPEVGGLGDGRPVYSPDGRHIAFTRGAHLYNYDLWLLDRRTGEERRITHDGRRVWGFDWLPDSSGLIYSSNRGGLFGLWLVAIVGEAEPTWIPTSGDQVRFPNIRGDRLVYDRFEVPSELYRLSAEGDLNPIAELSSKARESSPAWSPDGRRLAFGSDRTGTAEIFVREADGSIRKITQIGASMLVNLAWSPTGSEIFAETAFEGGTAFFLIDARTGESRRFHFAGGDRVLAPTFGPDGRSIFAGSDRGQDRSTWLEIWQYGLDADSEPVAWTDFGAAVVRFGQDGAAHAWRGNFGEVRRRGGDGQWTTVLEDFFPVKPDAWMVIGEHVHAVHEAEDGTLEWRRWSTDEGSFEVLGSFLPRYENGGLAVHPDGQSAVIGRLLPKESDLRLIELPAIGPAATESRSESH